MVLVAQQGPVEVGVVIPLGPLAEFAPHKEELFAGHCVLVAVQHPQVGELLPVIAGHLREESPFAVHDFIVRQRQNKVLREGVHHAEREFILVERAVEQVRSAGSGACRSSSPCPTSC